MSSVSAAQQQQTLQDEYAVYELLAPDTASFKTDYEVAVTTPRATTFFDRIGSGLQPLDAAGDAAYDLMTGAALKVERKGDYFEVRLARPVPAGGGQARLRIVKTYKSAASYRRDGRDIVFTRPPGLPRAAIVLPAGFQLTECNVSAQVLSEADGRIRVSFMHRGPGQAPFVIRAAPGAPTGDAAKPRPLTNARSWEVSPSQGPTERARLAERAHQDRDIVYFLQQPDTNAFSLYHDYTAPQSYRLDGDELVFERSLGRPRNSVVLPHGWYLTSLSIPGVIRQTTDGLTRIDFVNGRPDSIDVLLKGRRLAGK